MRLLVPVLGMLASAAPAWACDRQTLRAELDRAFVAWEDRDQVGFRTAREAAGESLACQSELLPRDLVRDLHVTAALSDYLPPRDEPAVEAAFRAALAADPGFALDPAVAPPGNLLQALLERARVPAEGPTEPVGAADGCGVLVDGREDRPRPLDRPTVLQVRCPDGAGAVGLLPPGAPLPRWAVPPEPEPEPVAVPSPAPPAAPRSRRVSVGLGLGGGGALLAAGGLYLGARLQQQTYEDLTDRIAGGGLDASRSADVTAARRAANGLGIAAQASAVVGLGLVTTAIVVRF